MRKAVSQGLSECTISAFAICNFIHVIDYILSYCLIMLFHMFHRARETENLLMNHIRKHFHYALIMLDSVLSKYIDY